MLPQLATDISSTIALASRSIPHVDSQDMGASAKPTGLSSTTEPQSTQGLGPSGFDPSRGGRYRKKPVEIDAFQWDFQDRNDWPEWAAEDERIEETFAILIGIAATGLKIHTPEGTMRVSPGDWIIRGVKGEVYPCKPDIFAASYEPSDSDGSPKGGDACGSVHDSAGPKDIARD